MNPTFQEIKAKALQELNKLQPIIDRLNKIIEAASIDDVDDNSGQTNANEKLGNLKNDLINSLKNKVMEDYLPDESFDWKVDYFSKKTNRAFTNKEFKRFIEEVEGQERAAILQGNLLSQKFKHLLYHKKFVGAKFGGSNKHTYYLPVEWLTDDGLDIRQEFYPPPEAFGNLAPEKRCRTYIQILRK